MAHNFIIRFGNLSLPTDPTEESKASLAPSREKAEPRWQVRDYVQQRNVGEDAASEEDMENALQCMGFETEENE